MVFKKYSLKQIFENEDILKETYNIELIDYLKKYNGKNGYVFSSVIMKDELVKMPIHDKQFFIINYDKTNQPGSHWVAVVKNGGILYHFGSYGIPPLNEIKAKFSKYRIMYNDIALQKNDSAVCGHLCVAFIEYMIRDSNKTFYNFLSEAMKYSNRYRKDVS